MWLAEAPTARPREAKVVRKTIREGHRNQAQSNHVYFFKQFSFSSIDCVPVTSVKIFKLIRFSHASTNVNISWNWPM